MDERCTLPVNGDFTQIITQLIAEKGHADFIIDNNGLERASGIIISISQTGAHPEILLNNGVLISVNSIIAINGIFKSDYTCC